LVSLHAYIEMHGQLDIKNKHKRCGDAYCPHRQGSAGNLNLYDVRKILQTVLQELSSISPP
jgi:hypothetical protein